MWITISGFLSHSYPHIQYSICLLLKTKRLSGPGGHFSLPSRLCVTFWPPRPPPPAPRPAHLFQTESVPALEPTAESDVSNWGWQDARSREDAAASPAGRACQGPPFLLRTGAPAAILHVSGQGRGFWKTATEEQRNFLLPSQLYMKVKTFKLECSPRISLNHHRHTSGCGFSPRPLQWSESTWVSQVPSACKSHLYTSCSLLNMQWHCVWKKCAYLNFKILHCWKMLIINWAVREL